MMLNAIAAISPIVVLQFAVLPIVAKRYDDYNYGLVLTLISLITLAAQPLSVSLGSSRLLLNQKYLDSNVSGDFNILLIIYSFINIIILSVGTYLYEGNFNIVNITLIILISLAHLIRKYLLVSFRLEINYKKILYSNIILIIGYLIGFLLFLFLDIWQLIYLVGEFFSLIYVIKKTELLKEPIKITNLFKNTIKYGSIILGSSFFKTAIYQIDRLLLYPILGPRMVAIYYVSILFGKSLSMLVTPIDHVILTYLTKMKKFKTDYFKLLIITAVSLGVITYSIVIVISKPILNILYPQYVDEAIKLIYITTLTSIFRMFCGVTNPLILKFCSITWQIWINFIDIIVYIALTLYLVNLYGIYGFCFAALIASVIQFIIIICVYIKNSNLIYLLKR